MIRIRIRARGWFPAMTPAVRPASKPRPAFDPATHRRAEFGLAA